MWVASFMNSTGIQSFKGSQFHWCIATLCGPHWPKGPVSRGTFKRERVREEFYSDFLGGKEKESISPILQSVTKKRGPPTPADGSLIIYDLSVGVVSPVL